MERLAKIESNYFPFLPFPEEENRRYLMIRNIFIEEPSLPVYETLRKYDVSISEIIKYYRLMQVDENLQLITNSIFYPRRIMFQVGRRMVTDFNSDREYIERLLSGKPVSSRIVEIHATKGTCNYNCVMCLWSDKNKHTYRTKNMEGSGLMSLDDWKKILTEIKNLGARTVVFSGGGEPLLNRDFFPLIEFAHNIGFATQLYTNGFYLRGLTEYEWDQILAMERIRFSIHSPFEKQYSQIIGVPSSIGALTRVRENLQDLIMKRNNKKSKTAIGIGFVIQAINFNQIIEMADFAKQAEVDFLDLRSDEVKISGSLNAEQQKEVYRQLNIVRRRIIFGIYNPLIVDLSDNLTAFANGEDYNIRQVESCMSKYYRPVISPFGGWFPCDLKAEPMFYNPDYTIGNLHQESVKDILRNVHERFIPAHCQSCMPSGQTGNAIFTKIISDYQLGIDFRDMPFFIQT